MTSVVSFDKFNEEGAAKRYMTYRKRKRPVKFTRVMAKIGSLLPSNQRRIFET